MLKRKTEFVIIYTAFIWKKNLKHYWIIKNRTKILHQLYKTLILIDDNNFN